MLSNGKQGVPNQENLAIPEKALGRDQHLGECPAGAERKTYSHPVAEEWDAQTSVGMRDPGAAHGLQGRHFQGL